MLLTTSDQQLWEFKDSTLKKVTDLPVRSAIYNQTGEFIIALTYNNDSHITFFKNGKEAGKLKLDFAEDVKRNLYWTYFITEFQHGTSFIYSAFFEDDDKLDGKIGTPLIFAVNVDLNPMTSMAQLKSKEGDIQFYYSTDIKHNYDEEDNLPIIKPCWIEGALAVEKVCLISLNHQTRPYIMIKDTKTKKITAYEYQNLRETPAIGRPVDKNEDELEDFDCLGTMLGMSFC